MPDPSILINYILYPPYVAPPTHYSNGKPTGVLVDLTEKAILECVRECAAFGGSPPVKFQEVPLPFNKWHLFNHTTSEFLLPMVKKSHYSDHGSNIPLTTSPGSVLIEVPDRQELLVNNTEREMLKHLFGTFPMVMFFLLMNWLAGSIFWYTVSHMCA